MQLKCVYRDISILNKDTATEDAGNHIIIFLCPFGFSQLIR